MPELAEVEHARRQLDRVAVGRTMVGVECAEDPIVLAGTSPADMRDALRGRVVVATHRHGKYGWLELDRAPHLVFHLGMSGAWRFPGDAPLVLASSPRVPDRSWPPRFCKLALAFDDGGRAAMTDPRRLGRLLLRSDPEHEAPIVALGFDPWKAMPTRRAFDERLARRSGTLKGLLLDQSFAAGIGNWMADEICFQAKLDPRRSIPSLTVAERADLRAKIRHVTRVAVAADADKTRFPRGWLFHHRWGRTAGARTPAGDPIEHIVVAGRTTAWVPTRQR